MSLRSAVADRLNGGNSDMAIVARVRSMPHLSKLSHPLIRHLDGQFESDGPEVQRPTISAVTDRSWWKQKSGRWRGAAIKANPDNDPQAPTVWLGAAGLREEGDANDFYAAFAAGCAGGSDGYLPQLEDWTLLDVERRLSVLDAWRAQVLLSSMVLYANAVDVGVASMAIPGPNDPGSSIANLEISVEEIEVEGEVAREAILVIRPLIREASRFIEQLSVLARQAVDEESASWRIFPLEGDTMSYAAMTDPTHLDLAQTARASGTLPPGTMPSGLRIGTHAHYSARDGLTAATFQGAPVEALCGHWFVPMHDHVGIPVCTTCERLRLALPSS